MERLITLLDPLHLPKIYYFLGHMSCGLRGERKSETETETEEDIQSVRDREPRKFSKKIPVHHTDHVKICIHITHRSFLMPLQTS